MTASGFEKAMWEGYIHSVVKERRVITRKKRGWGKQIMPLSRKVRNFFPGVSHKPISGKGKMKPFLRKC